MFKKWLTVLGAVVLLVCTSQLLWGGGGGGTGGDDHPWNQTTGGGGTSETSVQPTASVQIGYPITRIYIVRPAPMGGFYLMRISLPSNASAKTVVAVKKAGN